MMIMMMMCVCVYVAFRQSLTLGIMLTLFPVHQHMYYLVESCLSVAIKLGHNLDSILVMY